MSTNYPLPDPPTPPQQNTQRSSKRHISQEPFSAVQLKVNILSPIGLIYYNQGWKINGFATYCKKIYIYFITYIMSCI